MRRLLLSALCLLPLTACAPANTSRASNPSSTFNAAFAPEGVAWVDAGKACVARAPSYRPVCPALPGAAVAVGWNGGDAWAALPDAGLLVTLDRAARSVPVGRVVALTATRAYRQDGSAVTYEGNPAPGVPGAPTAALTGGDGQDYVLLAGVLRRVSDGVVIETAPGPLLQVTPTGVRSAYLPGVVTLSGTYRLTGTALQRLDAAGRVLVSVPHGPGRVGLVGADVVTVSPGSVVRVYSVDLVPLTP
ncbi:hypothetical protein E5F05_17120 [Deinococcus metallilatus]|uniref:Uncharacterized protein n=1 Tax=Deinococcus metallilatus TaxID=1211322 RepID=A0AAJ5F3W4_9DEIO|nr:hypothetical protein [Deinococcus metallilatus]MBB5294766.1 hypothetical protein [Deinococcus metallilatus]QBY09509.1 hypothetical protein E5F05_17120 [Deinococcus metallilatus]RXJ09514.1 hypothetical protein ERJ73_15960 [Deinococcus metallilatus]TLK29036.1 hypothetical protein FCS05_07725 [Deinococcus metallilatus]GMA16692.1 hypothetical protein GCM10025871_30230 [Deinococcus metallilatus]